MRRETKLDYGYLLAGIGVPYLVQEGFGPRLGLIAAMVSVVVGFLLLIWGHVHREKGEPFPIKSRLGRAGLFVLVGAVLGSGVVGVKWAIHNKPQPKENAAYSTNSASITDDISARKRDEVSVVVERPAKPSVPLTSALRATKSKSPRKELGNSIPTQAQERPETRQALARQAADLSQEVTDLAEERQKIEQSLPPIDPGVPENKQNAPWLAQQHYLQGTASRFHFSGLEWRCGELAQSLSGYFDLYAEAQVLKDRCRHPTDVRSLRDLSALLAKLAREIEHPQPTLGSFSPEEKMRIKRQIVSLIAKGSTIRDKAPMWVGEVPDDVDKDWRAWTSEVNGFLEKNLGSTEAERFEALHNVNNLSLNSRIHLEIGYLEQLLDRIGF